VRIQRHGAGPDAKSRTTLFGVQIPPRNGFLLKACHVEPIPRSVDEARANLLLLPRLRHRVLRLLLYINRFDETDANLIAIDPSQLATLVCFPMDESTRKNSFRGRPSIEPPTVNLAPVSETSCIVHGRCHVPSIAIMFATNPRYDTMCLALFHLINSFEYKKNDEREQSVDRSRYALLDPRLA
jgi:hypothetical protein